MRGRPILHRPEYPRLLLGPAVPLPSSDSGLRRPVTRGEPTLSAHPFPPPSSASKLRRLVTRGGPSLCALVGLTLLAHPARSAPTSGSLGSGHAGGSTAAPSERIHWASSFDNAMQQARAEQKFVMVDFFTSWCGWCRVLDAQTYPDSGVAALAARMVSVKVNAELQPNIAGEYGVHAYPTIVFLNPDGTTRTKIEGFRPPDGFIPIQEDVLRTDSELFALSREILDQPKDRSLRLSLARTFALAGKFPEAAVQMDTLLMLDPGPKDDPAALDLERLVYRVRAGAGEDTRKDLEKWVKKQRKHARRFEAMYFLARANEQAGESKDARKLYEEIVSKDPGSWFADASREKLAKS